MAVVLPAPAGAIASCSRVRRCTSAGPARLPGIHWVPFAAISSNASSTADCRRSSRLGVPAVDQAPFRVQDPLGRVEVGAGDGVDRRPVESPQHLRFLDAVMRRGQGNRSAIEHLIDQQVHQCARLFGGHVDGADWRWASARTCHICQVDRLASITAQNVISRLCDPVGVGDRRGLSRRCQCRPHHRRDGPAAAQHSCGFVEPGCALLSLGSGFVLGVAGLQGRLLRQVQRFDRGRRPAMIVLELDGQLAAAGVDVGPAGRPALVQPGVDADDLPDRPLRRIGTGPFREPQPKLSRRCCSSAVL